MLVQCAIFINSFHHSAFCMQFLDFGQGVGPIHRTQVLCQGFEPNLFTCPSQQETSSCDHSMDAGVICISELLQYILHVHKLSN